MIRKAVGGAGRSGAVRLVLRLCRRPGRDGGADLAGRPGHRPNREPELAEVVEALRQATRAEVRGLLEGWLDALEPKGRWALLKLMTGALAGRAVGAAGQDGGGDDATGRGGRTARSGGRGRRLCRWSRSTASDIEEIWHALTPPYDDLFAWLEGAQRAAQRRCAGAVPARHAGRSPSTRRWISRGSIPPTMPPNGNGTASACRPCASTGCRSCIPAPATRYRRPFPTSWPACPSRGRSTASWWSGVTGQVAPFGDLQQRLQPQDRGCAKLDGRLSGRHRGL